MDGEIDKLSLLIIFNKFDTEFLSVVFGKLY